MKNFLSIKLDNVSKGFEGKTVIDQITCEFKNKEVHVILGKSGTGKSVLLKMIMGLFKPELGRILIDNKDLNIAVNENDLTSKQSQSKEDRIKEINDSLKKEAEKNNPLYRSVSQDEMMGYEDEFDLIDLDEEEF